VPDAAELSVEEVSADYGQGTVLDHVSLTAEPGQATAILGANGAGKTTLARVLAGVLRPQSGRVLFDGKDISRTKPAQRARTGISLVPEGRMVFPGISVEENLQLGALAAGVSRRDADVRRVYELFPRLADFRRRDAGTLSGGEQQMVAIGRALMSRPRLLILDEPSLGMSPKIVDVMYNALEQALRDGGISMLVIEQDTSLALHFCSSSYVLRAGRVVGHGNAETLGRPGALAELYLG
jgi:branched-chain amino acid transport system ATP-binding protein